ncbi:MAG: hypothetical protein IPM16_21585 [Chloroflexi bacterium]|nr:hypothetical protein [Chloroflexota bacterium]
MSQTLIIILRYALIALIWIGALLFAGPSETVLGITALICAAIASAAIASPQVDSARSREQNAASKAKNDRTADPMALLTPEDLEDLRQEARERIRQRLIDGGEGELGTLDSLLAEDDTAKRQTK